MKMNRKITPIISLLLILLVGCISIRSIPTETPQSLPDNIPTEIPMETSTVTPEPLTANRILLGTPCQPTTDIQPWCLLAEGVVQDINPPNQEAQLYDYDSQTNRALYASHFPTRGGGPGNLSVTDLWLWDLGAASAQPTVNEEVIVKARFSPDGSLAFIRTSDTTNELVWRSSEGIEKLLATDVPHLFSFSPDGSEIAFTRESGYNLSGKPGLYVVEVSSGEERMISPADRAGAGSSEDQILWSPDGSQVILPINLDWLLVATDGSRSTYLHYGPDSASQPWASYLPNRILWYPDGSHLLVSVETGGPHSPEPVYWFLQVVALDPLSGELSVRQVMDDFYLLLGWDIPGQSAWVLPVGDPAPPQALTIETP